MVSSENSRILTAFRVNWLRHARQRHYTEEGSAAGSMQNTDLHSSARIEQVVIAPCFEHC